MLPCKVYTRQSLVSTANHNGRTKHERSCRPQRRTWPSGDSVNLGGARQLRTAPAVFGFSEDVDLRSREHRVRQAPSTLYVIYKYRQYRSYDKPMEPLPVTGISPGTFGEALSWHTYRSYGDSEIPSRADNTVTFRGSSANDDTRRPGVQLHALWPHWFEPGGHVFGGLEVAKARISSRLILGGGPGLRCRPQATYRDILTCYTFSPTNPRVKRRQT